MESERAQAQSGQLHQEQLEQAQFSRAIERSLRLSHGDEAPHDGILEGVSTASYAELATATNYFAASSILGRGGFGAVHRGLWRQREVAIKILDSSSLQGIREFKREINLLGKYRHEHLVPLLGYSISWENGQQKACLIYPLMTCSLEQALAPGRRGQLAAIARIRIAADAASGIKYLHTPPRAVLHRVHHPCMCLYDSKQFSKQ